MHKRKSLFKFRLLLLGLVLGAGVAWSDINSDEAVAIAEQSIGSGKLLSATQSYDDRGFIIYRVKFLMSSGVLKTVVVDAQSGQILE